MEKLECRWCGKQDYPTHSSSKFPRDFCSYGCYEHWRTWNEKPNCTCSVCGKEIYMKPSRLKRVKNGITCCKSCANALKSEYSMGEKNHQFGLIGEKNASYKEGNKFTTAGYILELCPNHPYPSDRSNKTVRVLQHRLVVERNSEKFSEEFFEIIDGQKVLKPQYSVHHINEIVTDNRVENLMVLTRGEHKRLHLLKNSKRDKLGRLIGVKKSGNFGEGCDANPEITDDSNISSES